MEEQSAYNQVTIKNVDSEDFVFKVDNVAYLIKKGETRNFPKFMAKLAVKHLVDKILNKKDQEGKLIANPEKRQEVSAKIVIGEEKFEQPQAPTTQEIIKDMNKPSDLEQALQPKQPKIVVTPTPFIPAPPVDMSKATPISPSNTLGELTPGQIKTAKKPEVFDQVEDEKKLPERKKMLKYAKDTLKLKVSDPEMKKRFKKLSDQELYDELQIDK